MNKIFIKDYIIKAIHWYYEEEHINPQNFKVNVIATISNNTWDKDDISTTLNYEEIKKIIDKIFFSTKYKLLEFIAENISKEILKFEKVKSVEIEIIKLDIWENCYPWISIIREKYE